VSTWLQRFLKAAGPDEADTELEALLHKRALYRTTAEFLDALVEHFPADKPLSDTQLIALVRELRGVDGIRAPLRDSAEIAAYLRFWREIAERTGCMYARGCYADTLLLAGRRREALMEFLTVFEAQPDLMAELGDDEIEALARSAGGPLWLRYRLAWLWAALGERADSDDDTVRERYSELLEEYAGDESSLSDIRRLGDAMDRASRRGEFPRALVRRGPTRHAP
jgi:hypothetical protein